MAERTDRRHFLNTALLGATSAGALLSLEEKNLHAAMAQPDQAAASTRKPYQGDTLPTGQIGKHTVSRLIMGGNLIGGFAHSRDLLYVSRLLREYNTEAKIFETIALGEESGINTIQIGSGSLDVVAKYRKQTDSKIQMILCVDAEFTEPDRVREQIKHYLDNGVEMMYTHGHVTDMRTMAGDIDTLKRTMDLIHAAGVPAGIGCHSLETPLACEKHGVANDFYVKTFHNDVYWSANPPEKREEFCWYKPQTSNHDAYHDNIFCLDPKKTTEFMATVHKPWVAFKVMAAGAMSPQIGFNFAYQGGADFVIAGMFDFQIAEDVDIAVKALRRAQKRGAALARVIAASWPSRGKRARVPRVPLWEPVSGAVTHGFPKRNPWHPTYLAHLPGRLSAMSSFKA